MSPMKVALFLAGVICAANAQTAQVTTTTTRPGSFSSFVRGPIEAVRGAANSGIALKEDALSFSTNAANQLATGVIGAKKNLATMANGIASSGAQFGTQAVTNMAGIGASLLAPVPVVGTLANVGSKMVGAGASMANAGLQTGISTLNAVEMAKLNAMQSAVTMGTGMAQSVGKSVLGGKKVAVNVGLDMASSAAGMVDSAVEMGTKAMNSGVNMVSGLADRVASTSNGIAANMQSSINGAMVTNSPTNAAGAITTAMNAVTNAVNQAKAVTAATNSAGAVSAATNSGTPRFAV